MTMWAVPLAVALCECIQMWKDCKILTGFCRIEGVSPRKWKFIKELIFKFLVWDFVSNSAWAYFATQMLTIWDTDLNLPDYHRITLHLKNYNTTVHICFQLSVVRFPDAKSQLHGLWPSKRPRLFTFSLSFCDLPLSYLILASFITCRETPYQECMTMT